MKLQHEEKPGPGPHNPVFENPFRTPPSDKRWVTAAMIFGGLKFGVYEWDMLPREVQDGVRDYIEHKFDINLDDYPPADSKKSDLRPNPQTSS